MKVIYTALIACLIIAGSCSKSKSPNPAVAEDALASQQAKGGGGIIPSPGGIQIPLNNCYDTIIGTDSVRVCFDSVLIDCRCPKNVTCIWAGFAEVQLTITVNGLTETVALSTLGPNSTVVGGRTITFVDLLPYPIDGVTPAPGSIKVVITIT